MRVAAILDALALPQGRASKDVALQVKSRAEAVAEIVCVPAQSAHSCKRRLSHGSRASALHIHPHQQQQAGNEGAGGGQQG